MCLHYEMKQIINKRLNFELQHHRGFSIKTKINAGSIKKGFIDAHKRLKLIKAEPILRFYRLFSERWFNPLSSRNKHLPKR